MKRMALGITLASVFFICSGFSVEAVPTKVVQSEVTLLNLPSAQ